MAAFYTRADASCPALGGGRAIVAAVRRSPHCSQFACTQIVNPGLVWALTSGAWPESPAALLPRIGLGRSPCVRLAALLFPLAVVAQSSFALAGYNALHLDSPRLGARPARAPSYSWATGISCGTAVIVAALLAGRALRVARTGPADDRHGSGGRCSRARRLRVPRDVGLWFARPGLAQPSRAPVRAPVAVVFCGAGVPRVLATLTPGPPRPSYATDPPNDLRAAARASHRHVVLRRYAQLHALALRALAKSARGCAGSRALQCC